MAANTKAKRSAAAKKAARTRKRNAKAEAKKRKSRSSGNKVARKIEKYGSKEDFTLKIKVMGKFTKKKNGKLLCRCCKQYLEPHFLNMDHKIGRKNSTKDQKLKKINYNEGRSGKSLLNWLDSNIGSKTLLNQHFQVLCWNCNTTKWLYKKCPHQRK